MHKPLRVKSSPPFFLHPVLHPPRHSHRRDDRGRNEPKEGEDRTQGEDFTHNTLCIKRLNQNRRERTWGEAFTRNTLMFNTLQAKGEEVKAKSRKTADARASRVRVGQLPCAGFPPLVGRGRKNTPLLNTLPRKNCNFAKCASPSLRAAPHCGDPRPLRHADELHQRGTAERNCPAPQAI